MVVRQLKERFKKMNEKFGELTVVKKAGGSIIESPALFSGSGKNIFVVCGNSVRSYSVETGDLVTIFSGLSNHAVGVALHPGDSDKLIAVSCVGECIEWECTSRGSCLRKIQLGENNGSLIVKSFSLVTQQEDESLFISCVSAVSGRDHAVVRTFCSITGQERNLFPEIRVDNHKHSLTIRQFDGEILLAGFCNKPRTTLTFCISYSGSETKATYSICQNQMTCVACHPTDLCVATGDITGNVRVWKNLLTKPVWTSYHWHTLPVQALAFSDSGSYFYSGGGECVLVRWLLEAPKQNRFLPRLGSEIVQIAASPKNTWIALSTSDNGIQLANSALHVVSTIQHFSWSFLPRAEKYLLPHEMTSDPRTKALVTNGRIGHLQFYSVDQGNLLFLLDVVGRNYLTQERSKIIKNTEVVKFAFNSDGSWLASVEFCEEEGKSPLELRLKFWEYSKVKQKYILNTSVENPHRGKINAIQFRPSSNNENLMCVTTGEDYKFRTWSLDESTSIYRKGYVWGSENVGFYRNLPVGNLSFSTDGSLMAVAFGPTLTVWVPGSNDLKCSLTRPDTVEHLSHVEFGRGSCVHLVVTGSKIGIAVWNLLSVSLLWIVSLNLTVLVSDPISDTMAAFSEENDIVIFSPNSLEPVFKQNRLLPHQESSILNAVFVPHIRQKNSNLSWQSASQLYFFNSKQELFCLEQSTSMTESEEGRNLDVLPAESFRPKTAYGALLAQQSHSDVTDTKKELQKHLGIPGFRTLRELVEAPAHSMPPLSLVGYSLLLSFISKTEERSDNLRSRLRVPKEDNMECSEHSDVEDNEKEHLSAPSFEQRKKDLISKLQSTETPSNLADTEQSLMQIQRNTLEWATELLT